MRRHLGIILLILVLAFTLVGCGAGQETPKQAVTNALNAVKNLDKETSQQYFGESNWIGGNSSELLENEANAKLIVEKIKFNIISSSIEGDSATVKTEITNIDMKNVIGEYINQIMPLAFENAFSENPLSEEEMEKKSEELLLTLLRKEDNKTVTSTVDIHLNKADKTWRLEMNESLQDALLGGMVSFSKDLEGDSGGDNSPGNKLREINNYIISDIWNKGFCDISHFVESGKDSIGKTMDIDFTLSQLSKAMEKKPGYDAYINGLSDEEYGEVKQIWSKLSPEIDKLYGQLQEEKPTAQDSSYNFDTGLFSQYQDAFSNEIKNLE